MTTKATPEAFVGDPISDTAIVDGDVPAGAYLVFRAYGPYPEQPTADDEVEAFFTSEQISVNDPGEYESGTTKVDAPGLVFWVETLHGADGQIVAEGFIGAPSETTIIRERPTDVQVTTKAVAEVTLGASAHDVAIVTGTVPVGAVLAFQAYRQDGGEAVCEAENLVFDSHGQLISVDEAGEYASAEVVFEKVGTYFWIETLYAADGEILHRGACGADDETTKVVEKPSAPPGPPSLAITGAGWTWAGVITALVLLVMGGTLWFGRRLAQYRERTGYVRDEDLVLAELIDTDDSPENSMR